MGNIPPVTKNLLIINVLCFVGMFVARRYGIDINDLAGLHFFLASDFNVAQLISYMFLHANFQHIFFNMFAVWSTVYRICNGPFELRQCPNSVRHHSDE